MFAAITIHASFRCRLLRHARLGKYDVTLLKHGLLLY